MTGTKAGRRLLEGKSLFGDLRGRSLGLEELDETWRRSRNGGRRRSGVDGEIGGSKRREIGTKRTTIRRG